MYTTTFYSFKGGVGRTLALVNVGVELANAGKKVLLVDFDLEAPGIDTFDELHAPDHQAGIVDFVFDYLSTGTPPSFKEYHYQAPLAFEGRGEVWIMPAGRRDSSYAGKLASIDWKDLYANKNGFLLLEDLKAQWAEQLNPDYVLIDSRTGHTEVGGICTRQLPDTVVVLFIPNEQNLSGLVDVVGAIRSESERSGRTPINLEFVASNVPSLDDEEEILKSMMRKFSRVLDYTDKPLVIDRYDSLHLLNQSIFVRERRRSRLSKSYRELSRRITLHNLDDREAALRAMSAQSKRSMGESISSESRTDAEIKIKEIINRHPDDAEILCAAARVCSDLGQWSVAELLFERTVEVAKKNGDVDKYEYILEAMDYRFNMGNRPGAIYGILELLKSEAIGFNEISQAVNLFQKNKVEPTEELLNIRSLQKLRDNELGRLASQMNGSREWQRIALRTLFRGGELTPPEYGADATWLDEASIAAIGLGHFELATSLLRKLARSRKEGSLRDHFNTAMATWGALRDVPTSLFSHVITFDAKSPVSTTDANYEQCLALSEFLTGNTQRATERISAARRIARQVPFTIFSCWRYLSLSPRDFQQDLDKMEEFFSGSKILPEFMLQ